MAFQTTDAPQVSLDNFLCLDDFARIAQQRMSKMIFEYVDSGAGDEHTMRWNRERWNEIKLKPRVLTDVSELHLGTNFLGQRFQLPILLAPAAYQRLYDSNGELATVAGANAAGVPMVLASFATQPVEEIAKQAENPFWFQLYVQPDREFTRSVVQRVEAAGCAALCVTADTPILGIRTREMRSSFSLPDDIPLPNMIGGAKNELSRSHLPEFGSIYSRRLDPRLTWKDISWFRSITKLPVLLKGILNPDDARRAIDSGASGIIVSNHGGRNLDTLPATAEALPRVIDAVDDRIPVLVDGGIRRGTDVLKALALGAKAVMIGRPYIYGLAVAGAAGVERVIQILKTELMMAMALTGVRSIDEIDRQIIWE
jgi:4-hydroxymandelate oxidase